MTHSSPRFSARVRRAARSEPPPGSLKSWPGADGGLCEVDADAEKAGQDIVFRFFLVVDDVLDRGAAAAAPLDRPVDADEPGGVFATLKVLGAFHRAGGILATPIALHFARLAAFGVGIEERLRFGAEGCFFGGVFEIHRLPPRPRPVRWCCGRAARLPGVVSIRARRRGSGQAAWLGGNTGGSPSAR